MSAILYCVWNTTTGNLLAEFDTHEEAEAWIASTGYDDFVIDEEELAPDLPEGFHDGLELARRLAEKPQ